MFGTTFLLLSSLLLILAPIGQTSSECPENFIPVGHDCVTAFVDLDRKGSFADARDFCRAFNPPSYDGVLWEVSSLDQLSKNIILTFASSDEYPNFTIWNSFNDGKSDPDLCMAIEKNGKEVTLVSRPCNESLAFVCAIRKRGDTCVDFISSSFCGKYSSYFCDTIGQLSLLCPKTCGVCGLLHACNGRVNFWDASVCENLAIQGFCSAETDSILPFCASTCCRLDNENLPTIGNAALTKAVMNNCSDVVDRVACPEIPTVNQCFGDSDFASNCMKSCCVYSQSIRESALQNDLQPSRRTPGFRGNIEIQVCLSKYDDELGELCKQPEACDSSKISPFCEETCCKKRVQSELPPSETSDPIEDYCDDFHENIYTDATCASVKSVQDCAEQLKFRKHCKLRCCELGYDFSEKLSDELCSKFTDQKPKCVFIETPKLCKTAQSDCEFTCCEINGETADCDSLEDEDLFCSRFATKVACQIDSRTKDSCRKSCCEALKIAEPTNPESTTPYSTTALRRTTYDFISTTEVLCEVFDDVELGSGFCEKNANYESCQGDEEVMKCEFTCCILLNYPEQKCSSLEDTSTKCSKLNDETKELCESPLYEDGCKRSCCELSTSLILPVPISKPEKKSCAEFSDTVSKCPVLATKRTCYMEPYTSRCQKTCCEIGVLAFTESPGTEDECTALENSCNKCYKLGLDNRVKCYDEPYFSGCKLTCCKLGFSPDKLTTPEVEPTTISGDICGRFIDKATKCLLLKSKRDPRDLCENDNWYRDHCERSCCLERHGGSTIEATELICSGRENELVLCESFDLTEEECATNTFRELCSFTCCSINGGITVASSSYPPTTSTLAKSTTSDPRCENSLFSKCTRPDRSIAEFCAAVVASHVHGSDNLCQNVQIRPKCEFSCCVYYYATDEQVPNFPDELDPDCCKNLVDVYDYKTCFYNYLEDNCGPNCQRSCCILKEANVPVNPGCYDRDDSGKESFCLTNCRSESECEKEACVNKCSFTCCAICSDPGTKATTTSYEETDVTTVIATKSEVPVDCSDTVDDVYLKCLKVIAFDPAKCTPSTTMYDTLGCNQHCCHINVQLLTTTSEVVETPIVPQTTPGSSHSDPASTSSVPKSSTNSGPDIEATSSKAPTPTSYLPSLSSGATNSAPKDPVATKLSTVAVSTAEVTKAPETTRRSSIKTTPLP